MSLAIHNTLSNQKEIFRPLEPNKVKMYVCGPTVYHYIHIGNARPMVFFDVVVRYLRAKGYRVFYVRNITDIDDRIIKKSQEEKKATYQIARFYERAFHRDMKLLGLKTPNKNPRATEHVDSMIGWIQKLIEKGFAYVEGGEVFYSIKKFNEYGKLSKKKMEDLIAGARVEVSPHKRDPLDFVLWKPVKSENAKKHSEPSWDSPWGKGRPGWHLECSVMSTKYLDESFDIHGGGSDLIFPHHENEIAQSEAYSGKPFVRYWMHNEMLVFGKEKMSKSLGNIITTPEFLKKYPGEVLKYILLSSHYRSPLVFNDQTVKESLIAMERIYKTIISVNQRLKNRLQGKESVKSDVRSSVSELWAGFEAAMDDDFNTPKAFGIIFDTIRVINRHFSSHEKLDVETKKVLKEFLKIFKRIGSVLGLFEKDPKRFLKTMRTKLLEEMDLPIQKIEKLIRERNEARGKKDWKRSDEIRDFLKKHHIILEDSPSGTTWKVES